MSRDIDELITALRRQYPEISVEQLRASQQGADDEGIWFIRHPRALAEVQIESPNGATPFLVESDLAPPMPARTVDAAARLVVDRLGLSAQR